MKFSRIHTYLLLGIGLCIAGCSEKAPRKGFEAVIPEQTEPARNGCPNLIDTYLVSDAQEQIRLPKTPVDDKDFTYFVVESLVADRAYNYALRMERGRFLQKAQDLQASAPEKYFHWRQNALLLRENNSAELLAKTLAYGPVYERRGQLHAYECAKGWVKVQQLETSVPDEQTGRNYVRQDDVWLARDKYGNLLIHTISYEQKPGRTFWAAGGAGMNLVPINDRWAKMQRAPDTNISMTWSEADLPTARRPVADPGECKFPEGISDFSQHVAQNYGAVVDRFSIDPREVRNSACARASVTIGFQSTNSAEGKAVLKMLEKDPAVEAIELLETRQAEMKLHYLVRASLRDTEH